MMAKKNFLTSFNFRPDHLLKIQMRSHYFPSITYSGVLNEPNYRQNAASSKLYRRVRIGVKVETLEKNKAQLSIASRILLVPNEHR